MSVISGLTNSIVTSANAQKYSKGMDITLLGDIEKSGTQENPNIYQVDYQQNSYGSNEYASYNNYGSGDYASYGKEDYSSYNDYPSNQYVDDSKYAKEKKNIAQIEREDNTLFICDNGIVVDDRINCPQKCPFNTPLEGVYVTDLDVCNTQPGVGVTCPLDTDLPGVVVTDEANCNIFDVCDASSTPLGVALGQDVKVADSALCQLSNVPNLQIYEDGPFAGFAVNDRDACDTLDNVQICSLTSDLPGVLTTDPATCNIFETCDLNTPLGASLGTNVEVVDADICQLQFAVCDSDSGLARALGLTGTIVVADEQLCELEVTSGTTTCPAGSDLEGVVVSEGQAEIICNLEIPDVVTCDSDSPLGLAVSQGTVQVTDVKLCELEVTSGTTTCPAGSDLEGVVVLEEQANVLCNLNIPELFTCPDTSDITGAQVTDLEICDLTSVELFTCAPNTNMGGAVVTDVALCEAPDDDNRCPVDTDLAGVYVTNPDTDCDIFEQCEPGDAIFSALQEGSSTFKVVDEQICQLEVPEEVELFECEPGSNLGAGAVVTDAALCNAETPAEQCPEDSTLAGVWVHPDETATCNLVLPETCPAGTALEGVSVSNTQFCDLNGLEKCPVGTDKAELFVMGDGDLTTTDELETLCDDTTEVCPADTALAATVVQAPADDDPATVPVICSLNGLEKCPAGTDLEGVFAMGDGDLDTTVPDDLTLTENCDLPDSNVEACPEDSVLENVLVQDDADPMTIPDIVA